MKSNSQFKNEALAALRGNWTKAVLVTLVYFLLAAVVAGPMSYQSAKLQAYTQENATTVAKAASLIQDPAYQLIQRRVTGATGMTLLVEILILMPFAVGYANAMRRLLFSGENELLANTFYIAFENYWHKVWGMLWMQILIFLWSLLLVIPGIIKSFSYAMTPFILDEFPELSASEAIHRSRLMMRGHKFDLFWLWLSFIGWGILCMFTFGIGLLWLIPYMETSMAAFYREVKADYELNGGLD